MATIFPPVSITPARLPGPVIIALPHSGTHYPDDSQQRSRLSALTLRRSEDAFLGQLLAFAPALGIPIIATPFARAYVDVNRGADELDPQLVGIFGQGHSISLRAAAGLGVVPRIVGSGVEIYAAPLSADVVQQRIAAVHAPYHAALAALIARTQAQHGLAVVLDFHSMPSGKWHGRPLANIVLGDQRGQSCGEIFTRAVEQGFIAQGLQVVRNDPYAGGYTTQHYGAPWHGVHVLQVEIDRGLYMDESRIESHAGLEALQMQMELVLTALMQLPVLQPQVQRPLAAE